MEKNKKEYEKRIEENAHLVKTLIEKGDYIRAARNTYEILIEIAEYCEDSKRKKVSTKELDKRETLFNKALLNYNNYSEILEKKIGMLAKSTKTEENEDILLELRSAKRFFGLENLIPHLNTLETELYQ